MKVVRILNLSKNNTWLNFIDFVRDEFESDANENRFVKCVRDRLSKFNATVDLMNSTVTFKSEADYTWFLLTYS